MSDQLEREIASRLKRAELPEAPRVLHMRTAALITTDPGASGRATELGRQGRLLLPLAAVLLIGAAAILGSGGSRRAIVSDVPATPAGPAHARVIVDAAVFEWCSPGGCEFLVELTGPGGPWQGHLQFANLGERAPIMPSLPELLATGAYSLRTEIHVFGDAIYEGESGPRDLGTTATCTSEFEVQPDTQIVAITLGFWLDRCAAGTVATANPSSLASFVVQAGIEGECGGAGGCDYRLVLTGPGGTWAAMPSTVKPASQLVISEFSPMLPPGSYRLTASSHEMSVEPAPGSGHQTELGVEATCFADFVVGPESNYVTVNVSFVAEACSAEAEVLALPTSTPGIVGPVPTGDPSPIPESGDPRERTFGPDYPDQPPAGLGVRIDTMALSDDRRILTVEFTDGGCNDDYEPWVGRDGDQLLVSIVQIPRQEPLPSGAACVLVLYRNAYHLTLPEPFTGSIVRDLNGSALILD